MSIVLPAWFSRPVGHFLQATCFCSEDLKQGKDFDFEVHSVLDDIWWLQQTWNSVQHLTCLYKLVLLALSILSTQHDPTCHGAGGTFFPDTHQQHSLMLGPYLWSAGTRLQPATHPAQPSQSHHKL